MEEYGDDARSFEKKGFEPVEELKTRSGIDQKVVYMPGDLSDVSFNYDRELGDPGDYPYTRGIRSDMYRGKIWTMRQYSGYATASESNRRFRYLLEQGQTGLSVAFDLPTQMGYDSDHPLAKGEVGKVGVPISSLRDMETLFEGIPLDKVSTSMTINATASVLLCLYMAVAKQQGVSESDVRGTIQNDILKEYISRGTYIYPPQHSMRLVVDVFKYCSEKIPGWNTISISGYHMSEAGATATQELAFTLSNGIAYVQAAIKSGLDVDTFGQRLSFFFASQNNLFEEIAKFRAARRMWARIMRERFHAKDPRSWALRFHTQTAGVTLTAQQPDNNVIRTTIQALAAVLGGTQSLHANSKDEALALPTEQSAQLSLRTQQILAYESGISDVVDPLGGSYYVENLTSRLEKEALSYMSKIEALGGAVEALAQGYQVSQINESAYIHQSEIEKGQRVIVGVNKYVTGTVENFALHRVDPKNTRIQIDGLVQTRNHRDAKKVKKCLDSLEEVARGNENTVPRIAECVEHYCTIGEISDVLRGVFGEHQGIVSF